MAKKIIWDDKKYKQLEELCKLQCTVAEIEAVMDADHKTINRLCKEHYKLTLSQVKEKYSLNGKTSLRMAQFRQAQRSVPMAIFLGKNYLGQTDHPVTADIDDIEDLTPLAELLK